MSDVVENFIDRMEFSTEEIRWCASEVERQGDGPMDVLHMIRALGYAKLMPEHVEHVHLHSLSSLVRSQPVSRYRNTPVAFMSGGAAADHRHVDRQMDILLENQDLMIPHQFVIRFLKIHPYEDGNGRVAALLLNLKLGKINSGSLVPLPNYF